MRMIDDEGIYALRNAIVEQACYDYVKARKYLLAHPNPVFISKKNHVYGKKWADIRKQYKDGIISEEEFVRFKRLHDKTLFKQHYERAIFTIKDIAWWFGSKQFLSFNLSIDKETVITKLEERAKREFKEGARQNRIKHA